jgi:ABC-type dipeptide/oligopeptide/nickel transport system permease component
LLLAPFFFRLLSFLGRFLEGLFSSALCLFGRPELSDDFWQRCDWSRLVFVSDLLQAVVPVGFPFSLLLVWVAMGAHSFFDSVLECLSSARVLMPLCWADHVLQSGRLQSPVLSFL